MRDDNQERYWWYSFFSVYMLQGIIAFLVAAPLKTIQLGIENTFVHLALILGSIIWLIGFIFEAGGDYQLIKFKQDPKNRGRLLTTGLWSLTRHPNYFGDALQWWGIFIIALGYQGGWTSFYGPLIMTVFIFYISGVSLLEKGLKNTKPGYEKYTESTPVFFPKLPQFKKGPQ